MINLYFIGFKFELIRSIVYYVARTRSTVQGLSPYEYQKIKDWICSRGEFVLRMLRLFVVNCLEFLVFAVPSSDPTVLMQSRGRC